MNRVSKKQRKALSNVVPLEISLTDFVRQELHEFVIAQGKRPRVRDAEGEVALDSYQHFSQVDPLEERAMEQMVIGVSTRKYSRSLEEIDERTESRSTSKSAVSRRFVAATKNQLNECQKRTYKT